MEKMNNSFLDYRTSGAAQLGSEHDIVTGVGSAPVEPDPNQHHGVMRVMEQKVKNLANENGICLRMLPASLMILGVNHCIVFMSMEF